MPSFNTQITQDSWTKNLPILLKYFLVSNMQFLGKFTTKFKKGCDSNFSFFRMLIISVSLGFGTIKTKLASSFKRIFGIVFLQFMVTTTETIVQLNKTNSNPSNHSENINFNMFMMARVLIDGYATFQLFKLIHVLIFPLFYSIICIWVATALVNTKKILRLQKHYSMLYKYNYFTYTLVSAAVASVAFMLWNIEFIQLSECLTGKFFQLFSRIENILLLNFF